MGSVKNFLEKTADSLKELSVLEITTLVGNFEFVYRLDGEIVDKGTEKALPREIDKDSKDCSKMCSRISLVSGDITTAMSEKFVTDYKELREYHLIREHQGQEIIKRNLEVVEKIATTLIALIGHQKNVGDDIESPRTSTAQKEPEKK